MPLAVGEAVPLFYAEMLWEQPVTAIPLWFELLLVCYCGALRADVPML